MEVADRLLGRDPQSMFDAICEKTPRMKYIFAGVRRLPTSVEEYYRQMTAGYPDEAAIRS